MKPDQPERLWPTRLVDDQPVDATEEQAQALFRRLLEVPPLSTVQLSRVAGQLAEKVAQRSRPRRLRTWSLSLGSLACVAAALVVWLGQRGLIGQEVRVPYGVAASLLGRDVTLIGPGRATLDKSGDVRLIEGRLAVRATSMPVVVETPEAGVTVSPGAVVQIELRSSHLTVATYAGTAQVIWRESRRTFDLRNGTKLVGGRLEPLSGEPPTEIERLMPAKPVTVSAPVALPAAAPVAAAPVAAAPVATALDIPAAPAAIERPAPHRSAGGRERSDRRMVALVAHSTSRPEPRSEPAPVATPAPSVPVPSAPAAPASSAPATAAPATAAPATAAARVAEVARMPVVPPPSAPAAPSRLAQESRLLADALKRLGSERDFKGALAVLDRYVAQFPDGSLRPEAERARVDALLKLDRRSAALAVLDHMAPDVLGDGELRVLRGELRAESRQLALAIADFDTALGSVRGHLEERARYGRASTRARLGDNAGARRELERYLELFPSGAFAAEARRSLGK